MCKTRPKNVREFMTFHKFKCQELFVAPKKEGKMELQCCPSITNEKKKEEKRSVL
jgi:hypothetical protein